MRFFLQILWLILSLYTTSIAQSDTLLYNQAVQLKDKGKYEASLEILKNLLKPHQNAQFEASILNQIGITYDVSGNLKQALVYTHKALKKQLLFTDSLDKQNAYLFFNLSSINSGLRNYNEAIKYAYLSLKAGYEQPFYIKNQMGFLYARIQKIDSALYYYQEALRHNITPGLLLNIGDLYLQKSQPQKALNYFEQAKQKPNLHLYTEVSVKYRLSKAYSSLNKTIKAIKYLLQADNLLLKRSHSVLTQNDKLSIARWITAISQLGIEIAYQLKDNKTAFYFSERLKMGVVLEKIAKGKGVLKIEHLQKQIGHREKLIAYAESGKYLYTFIIGRSHFTMHRLTIAMAKLKKNIEAYRQAIMQLSPRKFGKPAVALYQALIKPITPQLQGTTQLIIIPSLSLSSIPFEAFTPRLPTVMNPNGFRALPYLIRRYEISYYPSASLLFAPRQATQYARQYTGVAYTRFGRTKPELLFGQKEVQYAYGLFSRKHLYNNSFPKKQEINTKVLHISTHGFYDAYNVLGGLILGTTDTLTVSDLYEQSIKTELAILSGCQSGLGQSIAGEGVLGLPRALLYAGVRNIIASQFFLSDRSTYRFMKLFFWNLHKGYSYRQAMTYAKRFYINQYPFAAHWAPLVLIGR